MFTSRLRKRLLCIRKWNTLTKIW